MKSRTLLKLYSSKYELTVILFLSWILIVGIPSASSQEGTGGDLLLYDDELSEGWDDWSWDTVNDFSITDPVQSGDRSLSVTFTAAWAGLYLHTNTAIDTGEYETLRFWIHGGTAGRQSITIVFIGENEEEAGARYDLIPLPVNTWIEMAVPLPALEGNLGITGLFWHDRTGGPQPAFYLDRITVEKASQPVSQPTPTPQMPVEIKTKWDLWLNGTHLRGANVHQRRIYPSLDGPTYMGPGPAGPPFTQEDFDKLAALGANYVNISYTGLYTETPPYIVDPDLRDGLDILLEMIAHADMFAVISMRSGPGRSQFAIYYWEDLDRKYYNDSVWQDRAAQDAWVEMWRYIAERYRDNPIVVGYDLMVEPNSNDNGSDVFSDRLDIWEPDEFYSQYGGTLYDWNQLYPRITEAIREVDTETPILIAGNSYSGVRWLPYLQPTGDPRTVYAAHQYEPQSQYTHIDWNDEDFMNVTYPGLIDLDWDGEKELFDRDWLDRFLTPLDAFQTAYNVPVAVNEYGIARWVNNAADFIRDEMELFEERGLNYALWEWQPYWEPLISKNSDFNFRHGPDPDNHTDVLENELLDAIVSFWAKNTIHPSIMPSLPIPTPTPVSVRINDWFLY